MARIGFANIRADRAKPFKRVIILVIIGSFPTGLTGGRGGGAGSNKMPDSIPRLTFFFSDNLFLQGGSGGGVNNSSVSLHNEHGYL